MLDSQVKMPFAIAEKTGRIIGIRQADRGDSCDCRCLSCNTAVTARQGDVNQWHFGHRTNNLTTSTECEFSPVTALALIIRQELPNLRQFDLDEWPFTDVDWETNVTINGTHYDAFAQDAVTQVTVVMEIPFANDQRHDVSVLPVEIDIVLRVDTHAMAESLYMTKSSHELYDSQQVFDILLKKWTDWVSMVRWPGQETEPQNEDIVSDDSESAEIKQDKAHDESPVSDLCLSCGSEPGQYGKGMFCKPCVWRYVGPKFDSISDMMRHYK